jgi:hypothetical protein
MPDEQGAQDPQEGGRKESREGKSLAYSELKLRIVTRIGVWHGATESGP